MIVRIKSARDGYRRCGVAHPKQATDHPADRFTEDELARLQGDPVLEVTLVDGDLVVVDPQSGPAGEGSPSPAGPGEPAPAPTPARRAPAVRGTTNKKDKAQAAKGGGKNKAKETAKDKAEQDPADSANSSAKPAEGEGSEAGTGTGQE